MKTEIIERLKADTPLFFKKARNLSFRVGGSAAAVIVANSSMSLRLDETLISVLGYVVAVCVAIAGTSQLAKKE